jgi:hypothetical protein
MDMTTPMQPKPLVDATCKLGENGCFKDGRCHALGDCENKIVTNADHIRSMTDEELAEFLCDATYKENEQGYPIMRTVNKVWWHKWLKQPYGGE